MELAEVKLRERKAPTSYSAVARREFNAKPRIYFGFVGEKIIDDLENRHSRPYKALKEMIPAALKQLGLDENVSVKWRQNAGCSCGCSPGFIVEQHNFTNQHVDVWIDVK